MPDRAHLTFALTLHDALAPDRGQNACWSPYSVASALGMTAQAARGAARDEIVALIGEDGAEALRAAEVADDKAEFAVANTLWASDELPLNPDFHAELARWPGARARSAPFSTDPEAARKAINADVAETTRGLILELLTPGTVHEDTVASLVNALYLKVAWTEQFPEGNTEPAEFHAPGGVVRVPTMRKEATLRYAARAGWQAVAVPARGGVEAVVLLPDGELGDTAGVPEVLDALDFERVELHWPKLSLTSSAMLADPLRQLGVRTLFTAAADLSGLSPDPRLLVDEVVHEAVLRIDEQGFEGAAATAVTIRAVALIVHPDPRVVRVDRPHLVLIRHSGTGAIFFLAQVVKP